MKDKPCADKESINQISDSECGSLVPLYPLEETISEDEYGVEYSIPRDFDKRLVIHNKEPVSKGHAEKPVHSIGPKRV